MKKCKSCSVLFKPRSNRQKYCDVCQPIIRAAQKARQKQHEREGWLTEPVTLQEKLAALQNWGEPHKEPEDYYTDDFIYVSDYLKELNDEEDRNTGS